VKTKKGGESKKGGRKQSRGEETPKFCLHYRLTKLRFSKKGARQNDSHYFRAHVRSSWYLELIQELVGVSGFIQGNVSLPVSMYWCNHDIGRSKGETEITKGGRKMSEEKKRVLDEEFHVVDVPSRLFFPALGLRINNFIDRITSSYRRSVGIGKEEAIHIYWKKANISQLEGDYEEAVFVLKRLVQLKPRDAEVYYVLGLNFEKMAQYEESAKCYQNTIKLEPEHAEAYLRLGMILSQIESNGESIPFLERAIELNPNNSEAHFRLGLAYDKTKDYESAVDSFKQAIKIDPWFAKAHKCLGFTYDSMGKHDESVGCFKKAIELEE